MADSAEPKQSRFTRRRAIAGAAGVAAGAAALNAGIGDALASGRPFSPGGTDLVVGTIERIGPGAQIVLSTAEGTRVIPFAKDALYWREGPSPITSFARQEQVVVEGSVESGSFVGTAMINVYRFLEGDVIQRRGLRVVTDDGTIRIVPATRLERQGRLRDVPWDEFRAGSTIAAMGRVDLATDDLLALRIYD